MDHRFDPYSTATNARSPLSIPGFDVEELGEDCWRATTRYELTDFMASVGCQGTVHGGSPEDLALNCAAERIKAGWVRAAEARTDEAP
ncbi:hypothetical protein [Actinomadura macrotermitis]|uniref:hypothetical protein n=1 Tax=Actinomadura macrotermitis TaxID=2585200 RepID=UPI001294D722|nr:hypothetical protein [Actinomadura macrotermitis]